MEKQMINYFAAKLTGYSGEFGFQFEQDNYLVVFMGEVIIQSIWYDCEASKAIIKLDCFDVYQNGKKIKYNAETIIRGIEHKI